jgi:type VI secretion system protein VasG
VESGARNVDNILTNTLLPEVSRILLESLASGEKPAAIRIDVGENGTFTYTPQKSTTVPSLDSRGLAATAAV